MVKHGILARNWLAVVVAQSVVVALPVGVALSVVVGGCASEGGSVELTVQTYNAGLAYNFVPLAKERRQAVFDAVRASTADVLCLQEVWVDDDLIALEKAGADAGFATVFSEKTREDTAGLPIACTAGDTKELEPCAQKECGAQAVGQLVGCVQAKCGPQLAAISDKCLTCLASNLDKDLTGILSACAKGGGKYAFGGYNGLMLLTRKKATLTKHTFFKSSLIRRSLLQASFQVGEDDATGTVNAYCTHLTSKLSSINYPGEFSGYEEEQAQQVDALIKQVTGNFIVMGDMNTGAKLGDKIVAELPDNFAKFTAAGFKTPYLDGAAPLCTFCAENTLVASGADKGGEGAIIDHIFVGSGFAASATSRIHDKEVDITTTSGVQKSHISDHFGASVTGTLTWEGD